MESQFPNSILYVRHKQSEMLQGICDAIRMINLEFVKLHRFYGYSCNSVNNIEQNMSQMDNYLYQMEQEIQSLREKGM